MTLFKNGVISDLDHALLRDLLDAPVRQSPAPQARGGIALQSLRWVLAEEPQRPPELQRRVRRRKRGGARLLAELLSGPIDRDRQVGVTRGGVSQPLLEQDLPR